MSEPNPSASGPVTAPLFQRHDTLASLTHVEARLNTLYQDMRIISQDTETDLMLRDEVERLRYHIRRISLVAGSIAAIVRARREREAYERIWPPPEPEDDPFATVAELPAAPTVPTEGQWHGTD